MKIDPKLKEWATPLQAKKIDLVNELGSVQNAATALGIRKSAVGSEILAVRKKAAKAGYVEGVQALTPTLARATRAAPVERTIRFLLTAAQDETPVHAGFWRNLMAYADSLGARIMIGGFTYQKGLYEDHATRTATFAEEVRPHLQHENIELGSLLFAAKMNILPTAARPLSGLETYSRGKWAVFPHAKIQLVSVPALNGQEAALQMTTGACTVANYIEKKAGLKAEFHHVIGATIVEIDECGRIFCRQINATDDGGFQDLDTKVSQGAVTRGHRVEAITWGDLHREKVDPTVAMCAWGLDIESEVVSSETSMFRTLKPRHQFIHDLLDFEARNHHRRKDPHFLFRMIQQGTDSVEAAVAACARFIRLTEADWCNTVVVPSNHHDAYQRWLRETTPQEDPLNARFWCESNAAIYAAIERGEPEFDVFRWALARADPRGMEDIIFPTRNGSYLICQDSGGIECALHGDQGPNGARGSPLAFTRAATRMNTGHTHIAGILDGVYTAGLCGLMDQGYNEGLSSWSHTQTITYVSGKRTLVTIKDGKYRA